MDYLAVAAERLAQGTWRRSVHPELQQDDFLPLGTWITPGPEPIVQHSPRSQVWRQKGDSNGVVVKEGYVTDIISFREARGQDACSLE